MQLKISRVHSEETAVGEDRGEMPMFLENVSENDADAAFLSGSASRRGLRTRKKRGRSSTSWSGKLICPEKEETIKIVDLFCG